MPLFERIAIGELFEATALTCEKSEDRASEFGTESAIGAVSAEYSQRTRKARRSADHRPPYTYNQIER